jgi:hypothetical protein
LQYDGGANDHEGIFARRGAPSNNRLHPTIRQVTMMLVRRDYADFGPPLAAEKLAGQHDCRVSRETLRKGEGVRMISGRNPENSRVGRADQKRTMSV